MLLCIASAQAMENAQHVAVTARSAPESLEVRCAKKIAGLLINSMNDLHANPNNDFIQEVFSLPEQVQEAIRCYSGWSLLWAETLMVQHDNWIRLVAFSPDGELLIAGPDDTNVGIINPAMDIVLHKIERHDLVKSAALSPDGKLLATGGSDRVARIIDVDTNVVKHEISHGDWVWAVKFSPDGRWLATGSDDEKARIIDVHRGVVRCEMRHDALVWAVAFSSDGKYLATGSNDKKVRVYSCLTDNLKNAVLVSYLASCQAYQRQPNMQGWIQEACTKHPYKQALRNAFPGFVIPDSE